MRFLSIDGSFLHNASNSVLKINKIPLSVDDRYAQSLVSWPVKLLGLSRLQALYTGSRLPPVGHLQYHSQEPRYHPPPHPPPLRPSIWTFEDFGLFKFPPPGDKKPFKCPTFQGLSSRKNFPLQSITIRALQTVICDRCNDTFQNYFEAVLSETFAHKGEILSFKNYELPQTRKNSHENSSRPKKRSGSNSNSPLPGTVHGQMPEVWLAEGGGD